MSTSKDLTAALDALMQQNTANIIEAPKERGAAPRSTGAAKPADPPKSPSSGGIASPLTETAYANRTWYAEQIIVSTDGLFSMKIKAVKSVEFTDANGGNVVLQFKGP